MRRSDLEHIIRAAGSITGAPEIVIVGSQAILGQFPDAPPFLLRSMEADVFTFRSPDDALLIDGTIGELTAFHQTFGYHAHGVAIETATLPRGWQDRLIKVRNENTNGITGLCIEVHDLCASKLVAGREKDMEYLHEALRAGISEQEYFDGAIKRLRSFADAIGIMPSNGSPEYEKGCFARNEIRFSNQQAGYLTALGLIFVILYSVYISDPERQAGSSFFSDRSMDIVITACLALTAIAIGSGVFIVLRAFYVGLAQADKKPNPTTPGGQ